MATSPTQRTLAFLRRRGNIAEVVERWNPYSKTKHDMFGFIDIVWLKEGSIIGVQATSGGNHTAREKKIIAEPKARKWLEAGGRIAVFSWSKKGAKGKRKLWDWRITYLTLEELDNESVPAG